MEKPDIRFGTVTIDCLPGQVHAMVDFYTRLLDLTLESSEDDPFPFLSGKDVRIVLQPFDGFLPPSWPGNERGIQLHLDLSVKDLPLAAAYAKSIGAIESPVQYSKNWHIMLDPAGHPFCLCLYPEE